MATAARITLRPATRDDLPQIEPWYAEAAALACSDLTLEERFADAEASEGGLLLIATADDHTPIGLLDYRIGIPAKGWLATGFLALAAGRRGWGYGSEAVRLVEESAGATRFFAEVDVRNGLGLYFWLRLGYRLAHPGEVFWRAPDEGGIIAMIREGT
jgi:RimJ/RimL family protein N-acetyltransferase